jgi:TolA-binding protein
MNRTVVAAAIGLMFALPYLAPAQETTPGRSYQVTGRLTMEDGTPAPASAAVELSCNGKLQKRTRVYTNGDFSFVLGTDRQTPDISTPAEMFTPGSTPINIPGLPKDGPAGSYNEGRIDVTACEIRGALGGYVSNVIALGPRRLLDTPDVGTLVLHRIVVPDHPVLSANTLAASPKARAAFDNATELLSREKPDYEKAARELQKAVAESPNFSAAWHLLGRTRVALNDISIAREAFTKAINADPSNVDPYIHLARLESQFARWTETAKLTATVRQLNPYIADANYLNAIANFQLGEFDAAETAALEVQKGADPENYPLTYYILGAADARHGDFESAARKLQRFLQTKPDADTADAVRKILAQWQEQDAKQ